MTSKIHVQSQAVLLYHLQCCLLLLTLFPPIDIQFVSIVAGNIPSSIHFGALNQTCMINRTERPYVLCPDLHGLNHWSLNVASNVCMRVESGNKKLCSLVSCVLCPVVSQQSPVALVSAWKGLSPQQVDRSITPLVRLHLVSTWQSTLDTVHTGSKQGALHNMSPYSIYP